jgi:hypothetical protein
MVVGRRARKHGVANSVTAIPGTPRDCGMAADDAGAGDVDRIDARIEVD